MACDRMIAVYGFAALVQENNCYLIFVTTQITSTPRSDFDSPVFSSLSTIY
jgi:hypothetical protein